VIAGDDAPVKQDSAVLAAQARPVPSDEVRRYFEQAGPDTAKETFDPVLLRRQNNAAGLLTRGGLDSVGSVSESLIRGVPTRRYLPVSGSGKRLGVVWAHGGAWVHGDLEVYDGVARALSNVLGAEVLAVDYRLAPEHPFPAGLDDVWNVVLQAAEEFEVVVVAGDSSGGNLVAAAALKARDEGIRLGAQLLIYPVLDADDSDFKRAFRARYTPFLNQARFGQSSYDRIRWIWDMYAPDPARRSSALASPARATDLSGVAPAVIITAEHDILRGEDEVYAARLRAAGVPVELLEFPGQIHGFLQMRGVFADAARALDLGAAALRRLLALHQPDPSQPGLSQQ
jgi:acetyl esterase